MSVIGSISCSSGNDKTITFLHFCSGAQERKALENLIVDFERKNNCEVNLLYYDYTKGPNELISIIKGKQLCNVLAIKSEWLAQIQSNGLLAGFSEVQNNDTAYYNFLMEYCKDGGKLYCLPWLVNTRLIYINRKITDENKIEKSPKDFQFLLNYSELINNRGKYYGCGLVGPNKQAMLKNMMPLIFSFGGTLIDSAGKLDVSKNINSAGLYYYLKLSHSCFIETKREIENQFIKGNIAYCISDLSLLQKIIEKNLLHDFIIEQIPKNGSTPGISYSDAVMLGVCSKSTNKELALKFIKELAEWKTKNSFSIDFLKYGVPAQKNYLFNFGGNFFDLSEAGINSVLSKQIINSKSAPKNNRWFDIESIIEKEVEKAIYSEKSVEGSLKDAQEEITNFLRRNKN